MQSGRIFTQTDRHVASLRQRRFGLAGVLPVLLLTAVLTWFGAVGSTRTGIPFRQVMFIVPGVLALQLIALAWAYRQPERLLLRLTPDWLELGDGHAAGERFPLERLERIRVVRRGNAVHRIILHFPGRTLRLGDFLGMDTLRDLLVLYAGTPNRSRVRVLDPEHRVERNADHRHRGGGADGHG